MSGPLDGVRVVELAIFIAGPSIGMLLADWGAEVIKIEAPAFELDNRGKRSMTIDLNHPDGPGLMRKMVHGADVFVTNLLPARQERYGLTHEDLAAQYPRLIYLAVSGYGALGNDKDRPGFDYAAFWARSGMMGLMGDPASPPPVQRPGMGDHSTSLNVLASTLAALRRRERSGAGLRVVALLAEPALGVVGYLEADPLFDEVRGYLGKHQLDDLLRLINR